MSNIKRAIAASMLLAVGAAAPAAADEISDFYKGKSVNIVVGHEPRPASTSMRGCWRGISGATSRAIPTSSCRT